MDQKIIHIFNKSDIAPVDRQFRVKHFPRVFVSALTGQGFEQLKKIMADSINEMQTQVELYFDRTNEYRLYDLGREAKILRKEAATEGTICFVMMTPTLMNKWKDFLVK